MYFSTNMEGQRLNIIFCKFLTSSTKVKCRKVLCILPQCGRLKNKHKTLQILNGRIYILTLHRNVEEYHVYFSQMWNISQKHGRINIYTFTK